MPTARSQRKGRACRSSASVTPEPFRACGVRPISCNRTSGLWRWLLRWRCALRVATSMAHVAARFRADSWAVESRPTRDVDLRHRPRSEAENQDDGQMPCRSHVAFERINEANSASSSSLRSDTIQKHIPWPVQCRSWKPRIVSTKSSGIGSSASLTNAVMTCKRRW